MNDVGDKLLNGIESMYDNNLVYVRVQGPKCFRIDNGMRQEYLFPWLFNVYMNGVMKEVKMGMGRRGEGRYCLASYMQMNWFYVVGKGTT